MTVAWAQAGASGAAVCAGCHPEPARRHRASFHARALAPAAASRLPALLDRPVTAAGGVRFDYGWRGAEWVVSAARGEDRAAAALEWVFGAGMLAFTPVGRRADGTWFEHRVSWYTAEGRPGGTLGHSEQMTGDAAAALGTPQRAETIYRCFACHATGVRPGPDLSAMTPGVQCARCHGDAAAHVRAPGRGNVRREASVEACAECHRMPEGAMAATREPERADPLSIRFAPVGLLASRCAAESEGRLRCVSCHDPHGRPFGEPTRYEQVCAGCHPAAAPGCGRTAAGGCLACHMRKATPVAGLTFTDHRIRVYRSR